MKHFAKFITKHRKAVVASFLVLLVAFGFLATKISINHDMIDYLPQDVNSTKALRLMTDEFENGVANTYVLLEDVAPSEVLDYKKRIQAVDGIEAVEWLDNSLTSEQLANLDKMSAQTVGPEKMATIEHYYKDKNALIYVSVQDGQEKAVTEQLYDIVGENGGLTGSAIETANAQNTIGQTAVALAVLVPLILAILFLTTSSWLEPVLFLATIGIAIVINLGVNVLFGDVSYITLAVAPILQLAVSLDYAVFLCHAFEKNRASGLAPEKAMQKSMRESFKSISASALTTLFGFVALLFMDFKIGPDMGKSLVFGVLMSFIAVMTFLPALLLLCHKTVDKLKHKNLIPEPKKLGGLVVKPRFVIVAAMVLLIVPVYKMQADNQFTYGAGDPAENSQLAQDIARQKSIFGEQNAMVVIFPKGEAQKEIALAKELAESERIEKVVSFASVVGVNVPVEKAPEKIVQQFYGENYGRMVVYTDTKVESEDAFAVVEQIRAVAGKYYDDWYVGGRTANFYDMKTTIVNDNKKVEIITLAAIFAVLLLEFQSLIIPLILIMVIKFSFWLTLSVPFLLGDAISYIGYIVVSTVMMGAAIDYSILFTDNYLRNRATMTRDAAIKATLNKNLQSVLVSGLTLTMSGFCLALLSTESLIKVLGELVGMGAIMAILMSVILLPALLLVFDKLIPKLSRKIEFKQ